MSGAEEPKVRPFKYVLIPCDGAKEVAEVSFDGTKDDEFRESIRAYFRKGPTMSVGQRDEYKEVLINKSKSKTADQGTDMTGILNSVAEGDSTFEIVPIVLPTVANAFIGTSLYIDDVGRFKDLPLNDRASKIGQRDIRGDAFLCSNHDDPADDWERVDCLTASYEALSKNPVQGALDTSNQSQMRSAGMMRDAQTKVVEPQEAADGLEAKEKGNKHFAAGELTAAIEQYSAAIQLTAARRDRLDNRTEVEAMRVAALSNRALCYNKTKQFTLAEADCRAVIAIRELPPLPKVLFRLAQALEGQRDFAQALTVLAECESANGPVEDIQAMRGSLQTQKAALQEQEKKKYGKMFT